mmetsp:Transcript_11056/g.29228  ORF Transcript_11056/g.29228 Transcript_11056/m.29228 type:complete len:455 (-) Transcript_11056:157-1521(-)|eukprot:CAMPEP_0117516782 /NCGR_PEP_ID=MMETSP0784-20121206/31271_1 /TAXON_ID=39447 /ORGANISM="" /LENGTH=454 /DNA_ID=CAMNT_0005312637 /DNA_START=70 /DNA_END=1434 /DNA_ORIENTATION=+
MENGEENDDDLDDAALFFEDVTSGALDDIGTADPSPKIADAPGGDEAVTNAGGDEAPAAACTTCGVPGHLTSNCPFGHPEDIELGDLDESDSDDELPRVHPLLSRYISKHVGALTPKQKKGAEIRAGSRYFVKDKADSFCWVCGRQNHDSAQCPEKRCFFCAEGGHEGRSCPQRQSSCFHCHLRGHETVKCPTLSSQAPVSFNSTRCMRCAGVGHVHCGTPPLICPMVLTVAPTPPPSDLPLRVQPAVLAAPQAQAINTGRQPASPSHGSSAGPPFPPAASLFVRQSLRLPSPSRRSLRLPAPRGSRRGGCSDGAGPKAAGPLPSPSATGDCDGSGVVVPLPVPSASGGCGGCGVAQDGASVGSVGCGPTLAPGPVLLAGACRDGVADPLRSPRVGPPTPKAAGPDAGVGCGRKAKGSSTGSPVGPAPTPQKRARPAVATSALPAAPYEVEVCD